MNLFKMLITTFVAFTLLLVISEPSQKLFANNIRVLIEEQEVHFVDQQPVTIGETLVIPVRGVFTYLGYNVNWHDTLEQAVLTNGDTVVHITIGEDFAYINNQRTILEKPAAIMGDRTMLKLCGLLNELGYHTKQNGNTKYISTYPFSDGSTDKETEVFTEIKTYEDVESYSELLEKPYEPLLNIEGINFFEPLSTNTYQNFVIQEDGTLWAWGQSLRGSLGIGKAYENVDEVYYHNPIQILEDVIGVKTTQNGTTAALQSDGSLWVWGANTYGHLGNGTKTTYDEDGVIYNDYDSHKPTLVLKNVIYFDISNRNMMAITKEDYSTTLWVWGDNTVGQVGNNTTDIQLVPKEVLTDVISVSSSAAISPIAGEITAYMMAVTLDGSLYKWGGSRFVAYNGIDIYYEKVLKPSLVLDNVKSAQVIWGNAFAIIYTGELIALTNGSKTTVMHGAYSFVNNFILREDNNLWEVWISRDFDEYGLPVTSTARPYARVVAENALSAIDSFELTLGEEFEGLAKLVIDTDNVLNMITFDTVTAELETLQLLENVITIQNNIALDGDGNIWTIVPSSDYTSPIDLVQVMTNVAVG